MTVQTGSGFRGSVSVSGTDGESWRVDYDVSIATRTASVAGRTNLALRLTASTLKLTNTGSRSLYQLGSDTWGLYAAYPKTSVACTAASDAYDGQSNALQSISGDSCLLLAGGAPLFRGHPQLAAGGVLGGTGVLAGQSSLFIPVANGQQATLAAALAKPTNLLITLNPLGLHGADVRLKAFCRLQDDAMVSKQVVVAAMRTPDCMA